ncbi:MAG TPA: FkbM family methyltransferase [Phycisphaerales bacterium]|nr:FkbM family methyltransferase [Phycisphaerales bacterium]
MRRVWHNRRVFGDTRSWFVSARNAACIAFPDAPLSGRGRIEIVRTRDGQQYAVRLGASDLSVLYELERQHEYDTALREFPRPQDARWVIDMGANVGLSLRFWLRHFPGARVIGVEPDADNIQMCKRNLSLTQDGERRTNLLQACVGGSRRTVSLDRRRGAWGYRMADGPGDSDKIPVITVDDVLQTTDGLIDLIKMDIEGAEAEVFAHPTPWLARVRVLVIEVHAPFGETDLHAALARGPGTWDVAPMRTGDKASVYLARNTSLPHDLPATAPTP